ncbi:hypothetical protein VHEMI06895 [[Torrubiella] hemipterigena]|uniref:Chromo domain-containing protein n=1 Tax=[Torrubiella] hemipterigena TaxID=1531966 RepID=A0A0A1TKN0_9HYPO|nr:hypothetical protein VHEMI06895 [[Torrubiella] hemipterigena]
MPASSNDDSGSDAEKSIAQRRSQAENGSESKGKQRGRPKRQSAVKPATPPPVEDEEEEEGEGEGDEDDEDMDEDVFIVESILDHMVDEDRTVKFKVKWEGWDNEEDLTWEPEENLSANEVLEKYLAGIGGIEAIMKQTKAVKGKKRGRPSAAKKDIEASPPPATKRSRREAHPAASTPPAAAKKWMPPTGSWEDEIDTIDAQQDTGSGKLVVYLTWKNGQKTRHDTSVIYKKCPQMMLRYYERHIRVVHAEE